MHKVSVKEHALAWPGLPLGVNYTCVGHACSRTFFWLFKHFTVCAIRIYTARIWNAIRIRFRERYVGDKIVKIRRWWVPPKLFGVQNVAYRRRVRLQYASNTPQYPIRPQYVGVIVLNGFYCSSNYLQSDRHTIYIEAIFVIVPVVFKHCCVHTNQFPFHLCTVGWSFSSHPQHESHWWATELHASDMLQE